MNKLTFGNIQNESQLNHITESAQDTGCDVFVGPFSEYVVVTGDHEQIAKFRKKYTE